MTDFFDSNYNKYDDAEKKKLLDAFDNLTAENKVILQEDQKDITNHLFSENIKFLDGSAKYIEVATYLGDKGEIYAGGNDQRVGNMQVLMQKACDTCNNALKTGAIDYENPNFSGVDGIFGANSAYALYQIYKVLLGHGDISSTIPFDGILTDEMISGMLSIVTVPGYLDGDPTVTDPTVTDPTVTDPTVTDPTVTDPTVTDPTVTDPTVTDPTVTDPTVTDPTVTDPTVTDPTVTDPFDEEFENIEPDLEQQQEFITTLTVEAEQLVEEAGVLITQKHFDKALEKYAAAIGKYQDIKIAMEQYNVSQEDDDKDYTQAELDAMQKNVDDTMILHAEASEKQTEWKKQEAERERHEQVEVGKKLPEELRSLVMNDETNNIVGMKDHADTKYYYTVGANKKERRLRDDTIFPGGQTVHVFAKKGRKKLEGVVVFTFTPEKQISIVSKPKSFVELSEMRVVDTEERLSTMNPSMEKSVNDVVSDEITALADQMKGEDKKAAEAISGLEDLFVFPELPKDFPERSDADKLKWYDAMMRNYNKLFTDILARPGIVPSVKEVDERYVYDFENGERKLDDEESAIYKAGIIALNHKVYDALQSFEGYVYTFGMLGTEEPTEFDDDIENQENVYGETRENEKVAMTKIGGLKTTYVGKLQEYAYVENQLVTNEKLLKDYKTDGNLDKILETYGEISGLETRKLDAHMSSLWIGTNIDLLEGDFDIASYKQNIDALGTEIGSQKKDYEARKKGLDKDADKKELAQIEAHLKVLESYTVESDLSDAQQQTAINGILQKGGRLTIDQLKFIGTQAEQVRKDQETMKTEAGKYHTSYARVLQLQDQLKDERSGSETYISLNEDLNEELTTLAEIEKNMGDLKETAYPAEGEDAGILQGLFGGLLRVDPTDVDKSVLTPLDDLADLESDTKKVRGEKIGKKEEKWLGDINNRNIDNGKVHVEKEKVIDAHLRKQLEQKTILEEAISTLQGEIIDQIDILLQEPTDPTDEAAVKALGAEKETARKVKREKITTLKEKRAELDTVNHEIAQGYYEKQLLLQKKDQGHLTKFSAEVSLLDEHIDALTIQQEGVDETRKQKKAYLNKLIAEVSTLSDIASKDSALVKDRETALYEEIDEVGNRIDDLDIEYDRLDGEIIALTTERNEKQRVVDFYQARIAYIGEHAEYAVATKRLAQIKVRIGDQRKLQKKYQESIDTINDILIPAEKKGIEKVEGGVTVASDFVKNSDAYLQYNKDIKQFEVKADVVIPEDQKDSFGENLVATNESLLGEKIKYISAAKKFVLGTAGNETIRGHNARIAQLTNEKDEYKQNINEIELIIAEIKKEEKTYSNNGTYKSESEKAEGIIKTRDAALDENKLYGGLDINNEETDYHHIEVYTNEEKDLTAYPDDESALVEPLPASGGVPE